MSSPAGCESESTIDKSPGRGGTENERKRLISQNINKPRGKRKKKKEEWGQEEKRKKKKKKKKRDRR